jgi:beta-glucuronidase
LFTEEWQQDYMREHFKAFDEMRANTTYTFIGEMIWNFADFMTKQGLLFLKVFASNKFNFAFQKLLEL